MQGQLVPLQVRHHYRRPAEAEGLSRTTESSQTPSHLESNVMSNKCTGLNKCSLLIASYPKAKHYFIQVSSKRL